MPSVGMVKCYRCRYAEGLLYGNKLLVLMNKHISIAIFFAIIYYSCSISKTPIRRPEKNKDAIQLAIDDFTTKCKLYKEDSIFRIKVWNLGQYNQYKDFVVVSILGLRKKIILEPEDTIGSKGKSETRVYEKDAELFRWRDDNYPISQAVLKTFQRHNLIEMDSSRIKYPEYPRDDSQEAAIYFFCKDNLAIYKRVVTAKGVGYFKPPALKCSEK